MLKEYKLEYKSPEWFAFRKNGIGCSEIGIVTGTAKWGSRVELFYQKLGLAEPKNILNERMKHGTMLEAYILNLWKYYDGRDWIHNHEAGKVYRNHKEISNVVYQNDEVPFIFYTPDAVGPAGIRGINGNYQERDFPIEVKNIDSLYYHQNDHDLPLQYYDQLYGEMIVLDAHYGEFAYLVGGNTFSCKYVEREQAKMEKILEMCYTFWYYHVLPSRKLMDEYTGTTEKERQLLMFEIQKLEPDPDDTEAYKEFMTARLSGSAERMVSTPLLEEVAKAQEVIKQLIKGLEERRRGLTNILLQHHVHNEVMYIDGDKFRSINNKQHRINVVEPPTQNFIQTQLNNLTLIYEQ